MLTHPTHDRLVALGLTGMAKSLEEQRQQPDVAALAFEERLALMVDREAIERENRRLASRLKFASLRQSAVVEDTPGLHGERFFVKQPDPNTGRRVLWVTPLFVALVMIEVVDLIFAVDSVPTIFAITTDPFIIYTSNIFAILGLRALYFAFAAIIDRFAYLKQALALVLVFIGSKIFVADMFGWEKFPATVSLGVTITLIAAGIVFSLYRTRGGDAVTSIKS